MFLLDSRFKNYCWIYPVVTEFTFYDLFFIPYKLTPLSRQLTVKLLTGTSPVAEKFCTRAERLVCVARYYVDSLFILEQTCDISQLHNNILMSVPG